MDVFLFDNSPIRRNNWSKICDKRSDVLQCFDALIDKSIEPSASSRVMIFDVMVVKPLSEQELIGKLPFDILAFSVPHCDVATASRLMHLGARWVFDSELDPYDHETGYSALVREAIVLNDQKTQFRKMLAIFSNLTAGERSVMELAIKGVVNKSIAAKLGISCRTVEARRARVYKKCGVESISELVRFTERVEHFHDRFAL